MTRASIAEDIEWVTESGIEEAEVPTAYVARLLAWIEAADAAMRAVVEWWDGDGDDDFEDIVAAIRAAVLPEEEEA